MTVFTRFNEIICAAAITFPHGLIWAPKWEDTIQLTHIALSISSPSLGTPRDNMIPRFILAGSRAQFEIPMKATRCGFSSVSMMSSAVVTPSSSNGCKVLRGMRGESSARPTSSRTTTETNLSGFFPSCNLLHCLKVATIPSGVERGLHWYDAMWTYDETNNSTVLKTDFEVNLSMLRIQHFLGRKWC